MSNNLINILALSEEEKTIYFKNRNLEADEKDLLIYKIFGDYLKAVDYKFNSWSEFYLEVSVFWMNTLLNLKKIEIGEEIVTLSDDSNFKKFYEIVLKYSEEHDIKGEDLNELMYRLPWHNRIMLIQSNTADINSMYNYINNVSTLEDLSSLNFPDVSYMQLSKYDHAAIETYCDDIKLKQEELFNYQITKNLQVGFYLLENLKDFIENKKFKDASEKDDHGYNIFAHIFVKHFIEKKEDMETLTLYFMNVYSAMCFWHFENTKVKSTWFVKEGVFEHLKKVKKKLLK